jgi:tetratricopeptide (TPR) repeat protein
VALMAIKGSLREASLPDVIQLLHLGRRTGCLAITDRQNLGYIWFEEGRISYASIVNRRDRLGDMLVRHQRITLEQLQQAIDAQSSDRESRLGELLMGMGAITREELQDYIRLQIEEAVYYLFTWTTGTFNFEAGVRPDRQDFLVQINPEWLLLEGARRVDEWSLIEKKIPSFDLLFSADRSHASEEGVPLSEAQQQLLSLLDGTRDVQQLVDETGMVEFEVGKALYGLITAGYVRRTGTSTASVLPRASDSRIEEHRNLGIAFYKTGMFDEALREFRRVAELRPQEGSAPFFLGLIALKQGSWNEAVNAFQQALEKGGPRPAALHNLAFALEQLGRHEDAEAAYTEAAARARDDWRIQLGWAGTALQRGDAAAARARLDRSRELLGDRPVPARWYWADTLARVLADDPEGALSAAQAGAEAHPRRAVLRNNLAVLLELRGDAPGAERELQGGLQEDAALPQLSKNMGDLLYRAGRYEEARDAYERALRLEPALGDDLHFKLGNIAHRARDAQKAREYWTRATELNPAHQLARANLEMLEAVR